MTTRISILKALGIIAVVAGHLYWGPFQKQIYLYHMPLFFFISGYLYKEETYLKKPLLFLTSRLKTLYLPYVIICTIFIFFHGIFLKIGIYSTNPIVQEYVYPEVPLLIKLKLVWSVVILQYGDPLLKAFWFIQALIVGMVLFYIIRLVSMRLAPKNHFHVTFFTVGCLFLLNLSLSSSVGSVSILFMRSMIGLFFICLGFLYRRYESSIKISIGYAALALAFLFVSSRYNSINIAVGQYGDPGFLIACSLTGIYFNIWVAHTLAKVKTKAIAVLILIGDNTYSIMAFHLLAFKVITFVMLIIYGDDLLKLAYIFPGMVMELDTLLAIFYCVTGVILPIILWSSIKNFYRWAASFIQNGSQYIVRKKNLYNNNMSK